MLTRKLEIGDYCISRATGCWLWLGATSKGYGRINYDRKAFLAHRYVYTHLVGEIPDGLCLDHLCRNTLCVNPQHLDPVTPTENKRRGKLSKYLHGKCPVGHILDETNLYVKSNPQHSTQRYCRICHREYSRLRYIAKKQRMAANHGK